MILTIEKLYTRKKTLDNKGNVVNEIKTKINIGNENLAKSIFNNIGLYCWCNYICKNYEFKKGKIILNVQYVKELEVFIEIEEFKSISKKSDKEKFNILTEIIKSFHFTTNSDYSCKKPYMFFKLKNTTIDY